MATTYSALVEGSKIEVDGEVWVVRGVSPAVEVTAVDPQGIVHCMVQAPNDPAYLAQ